MNFEDVNQLTQDLIHENKPLGDAEQIKRIERLNYAVNNISIILKEIHNHFNDNSSLADTQLIKTLQDINQANLEIAKRITDKDFYVGIIGEFSCGKSTFINAMLEQRFLIEDVLQGTTCSKTAIKYANEENITVIFHNDKHVKMRKAGETEILLDSEKKREFLRIMTADEDSAKNIREVVWESPIEVLSNGLCIVDTPGIGSLNPRHTEVAKSACQDCDALLVLTNLDKALSQDLTDAVKEIAGPQANNCIFIGTRKDQLQPKELPRMRKHFQKRLNHLYGHNCQFEFVSAFAALEEFEGKRSEEGGLTEFRNFRSKIKELLESNRHFIQSMKAAGLVGEISKDVRSSFENKKEDFDKKIAQYQKEIIDEDSKKWSAWATQLLQSFNSRSIEIKSTALNDAESLVECIKSSVKSRINFCDDTTELKKYLKSGISSTIESFSDEIQNSPYVFLRDPLLKVMDDCQEEYAERFRQEYKKIENIFGVALQSAIMHSSDVKLEVDAKARKDGFNSLSNDIESEENFKIGGGLATGIGISMLVPGVGWVIGGALTLIGGILGAGLLKSLDSRKDEACDKVDESMGQFEKKLRDSLTENFTELQKELKKHLNQYITTQKNEYMETIRRYNDNLERETKILENTKIFLDEKLVQLRAISESMDSATQRNYFFFDDREV